VIICVPDVLTAQELAALRADLQSAPFVDGSSTAGWSARTVKKNQQIDPDSAGYERMADIVRAAFHRNGLLQAALLPAANTRPLFNRYVGGMEYGAHVDAPVMGTMGGAVRSDIAITVFLSDPDRYDGGELVTHASGGIEYKFKLEAGAAIAYPANTLHHVSPVTRGARDAAIIWVQSMVRDPARRELLWDLENAKRDLFSREGKSRAFDAVSRSHANLLRMWAEVAS
jgi:PKHD-type hydroxylase